MLHPWPWSPAPPRPGQPFDAVLKSDAETTDVHVMRKFAATALVALALVGCSAGSSDYSTDSGDSTGYSTETESYGDDGYSTESDDDYSTDTDYSSDYSTDSDYSSDDEADLDCSDIGHPVEIDASDPHGLDADGDGIGCESW